MAETEDVTVPVLMAVSVLPGGIFWRQNTGTFRTMDYARVVKVAPSGIADIMGCYVGWPIAIETKVLKGKLRETQVLFRAAWESAHGIYIVARSPEQAVSELQRLRERG